MSAVVTMARALLVLKSVVALVVCVSAFSENEYSVLNSLLKSPVRKELENSKFSEPDVGVVSENDVTENNVTSSMQIVVAPTVATTAPVPTFSLDDVTFRDGPGENPIDEGVVKMTEIYRDCTRKIGQRVESVLNWKFSKSNTEKDLIQLKEYVSLLYKCLKVQSFRYFDSIIKEDSIPVTSFVDLVKDSGSFGSAPNGGDGNTATARVSTQYVSEIVNNEWSALLLDRLSKLLQTHSMKFRFDENAIQGRGRRRDHKMFAMMLMGFMVMASILIPMGFQFLTVLGGKSLLMAKMALIMSAINGLKKIATSHVGYGFYHTAPDVHHEPHHHHTFHDKLFKVRRDPPPPEFL